MLVSITNDRYMGGGAGCQWPVVLFLLSPVLSNYVFYGAISIGDLLFFSITPWLIVRIRFNKLVSLIQVLLVVFLFAISFFIISNTSKEVYYGFYRSCFFLFSVIIISCLDINKLCGVGFLLLYRRLAILFSILIILQYFLYIKGLSIPFQLPIDYYEPDTLKVIDHVYRSGGVFKEPSYYMLYVTPMMFYLVIRRDYLSYTILLVAGVLSTSSLVFFISIITLLYFPIKYVSVMLTLLLILILAVISINMDMVNGIFIDRIIEIFENGGTLTTRFIPIIDAFNYSGFSFFATENAYTFLLSDGQWFSSLVTLYLIFGCIGICILLLSFMGTGIVFFIILSCFLATTHFMSGVFAPFIVFSFLIIRSFCYPQNKSK